MRFCTNINLTINIKNTFYAIFHNAKSILDGNGNFIGKLDSNTCAMMMIIMIIVIKSLIHKFFLYFRTFYCLTFHNITANSIVWDIIFNDVQHFTEIFYRILFHWLLCWYGRMSNFTDNIFDKTLFFISLSYTFMTIFISGLYHSELFSLF